MTRAHPALVLLLLAMATALARAEDASAWLDQEVARIGDVRLTRRTILRQDLGVADDERSLALRHDLDGALRRRVRGLLLAEAARRAGVVVGDEVLEATVREQLERSRLRASETPGEAITVDQWLARSGYTRESYRERVRAEMLALSWRMLLEGAFEDAPHGLLADALPADALRSTFEAHPGAFDVEPGRRLALFRLPIERFLVEDVPYLEVVERLRTWAARLENELGGGTPPEVLARRYGLPDDLWYASPPGEFVDPSAAFVGAGTELARWLFDDDRRPRETWSTESSDGFHLVGVLEVRPARKRTLEEARPLMLTRIRTVYAARRVEEALLALLGTADDIGPPSLVRALEEDARATLARLADDPVHGLVSAILALEREAEDEAATAEEPGVGER